MTTDNILIKVDNLQKSFGDVAVLKGVNAEIKKGDVIRRIGINTELGWSKVEYNGQTLYCVSSYLMLAEDAEAGTTE